MVDVIINVIIQIIVIVISKYDYKWLAVCVLSHGRRVANVDQIIGCDGQVKNDVDGDGYDNDGDDNDYNDNEDVDQIIDW